ncbi:DUF6765 family protein [Maridesulfovibrio hydrothermalis]|uniref:Putative signal peptide protein n=1 Tax=Maridesulfovibrio hydrothermalis AM13 = DSM 14728 TaxID=1121451 RepID=L0R7C7_9BACT|nr:DUF6765 family protein [Maridesulfovibrio hydrothermalis]CCO22628.1 putative signal peptide protein [Maridesulfovibrio hydrothermalis AM13 = DSM 14728]
MQKDMHYYGTYALARAAGILQDPAQKIASASQFVDDNAKKEQINFTDNASLNSRPTAHHCDNIRNVIPEDQRVVWVPFHFLPGGKGNNFEERIVCQKDSEIANQMVENHLVKVNKDFYLELLGITAHVYADTFSHYGFSGLSSDMNDVKISSITLSEKTNGDMVDFLQRKSIRFWEKIKTSVAEFGSNKLGHGGVYTYPDAPFLEWSFEYEDERTSQRNNQETFLEGSKALYEMFRKACELKPDIYQGDHRSFAQIEASLKDILAFNGDEDERIENWGECFSDPTSNFTPEVETFPRYLGDDWNQQRNKMDEGAHSSEILKLPVFNFYKAASYHRHYVLRDLLPKHGIVVA